MMGDNLEINELFAREKALLHGVWRQVGLEADGVVDPPDEHTAPDALCYFAGTHFLVSTPDGTVLIEGDFELDPSSNPKRITWIDSVGADAGKRIPAIYTLESDSFQFIASDPGQPWPTAFVTTPGLTMRTFVRHQ